MLFTAVLFICCFSVTHSFAFIPPKQQIITTASTTKKATTTRRQTISVKASTSSSSSIRDGGTDDDGNDTTNKMMGGITTFETWFQSAISNDKDNTSMQLLRHAFFSNGRGLEFLGTKNDLKEADDAAAIIISLPKDLVLQSKFTKKEDRGDDYDLVNDWDVVLSLKLLKECKLGEKSSLYG